MLLSRFRVVGHSMIPSLLPGDEILISSIPFLFSSPKTSDVILIKDPTSEKRVIKRVARVKNNTYFVLGDNKTDSKDSNSYGWIPKKRVIGKMVLKIN